MGDSFTILNFGRFELSLPSTNPGLENDELAGEEPMELAVGDVCTPGQMVISVLWVTVWNLANDRIREDLLEPECRTISGLDVAIAGDGSR